MTIPVSMNRIAPLAGLVACLLTTPFAKAQADTPSAAGIDSALQAISADSLRGHLSFIASDLLEGRDTPSPGLDIAAHYIASQFRRAGLEPAGDDGYFQTTEMTQSRRTDEDFSGSLTVDGEMMLLPVERISLMSAAQSIDLQDLTLFKVVFDEHAADALAEVDLSQHIVITDMPSFRSVPADQRRGFFGRMQSFMRAVRDADGQLILTIDTQTGGSGVRSGGGGFGRQQPAMITLHGEDTGAIFDRLEAGATDATATIRLDGPTESSVKVRNVVGVIRGSDPELAETCVLLTGHYDHIGIGTPVDGDAIYNGANDDGSGTVSVIEIASALAKLSPPPRRSMVFVCVYGEERGLLGSRHYAANPVFPLNRTIANINLEHVGRTDDDEGPSVNRIMVTGHDYSEVTGYLMGAAEHTGIEVFHHPLNSDRFFASSDNVAFARHGVPAHTVCTAFIFPDYHGAGDHWDLVDYDNMAIVCRTVAAALVDLANCRTPPRWTEDHRRTDPYIRAWRKLHGIEDPEPDVD